MAENYDVVCSCCADQGIDPGYYICEKCRDKLKHNNNKQANKEGSNNDLFNARPVVSDVSDQKGQTLQDDLSKENTIS